MIAYLAGNVLEVEGLNAVINVNGVGYEVLCTRSAANSLTPGEAVTLTTYTEVREDAIRIFGFASKLEKQTFLLLTVVKGIGPKSALEVISRIEAKELLKIIAHGDLTTLKSVKGIGQKTAERIIVELKDKVAQFIIEQRADRGDAGPDRGAFDGADGLDSAFGDAKLALLALGFGRRDVEEVISTLQKQKHAGVQLDDSGAIVREALKLL